MSKELIANLRGENLDCNCAAYSRSECSCSTNWPVSFCKEAADALEEAERIIEAQRTLYQNAVSVANKLEEAERKLEIAREALESFDGLFDYTGQAEKRRREALAQLGETNAGD